MTPQTAQQHITDIQASQRPALVKLSQKLVTTYLIPLAIAFLLSTVGAMLLANILPSSTTSILVFAANIAVFYYVWSYLDKRTQATALFSLYIIGTRQRRALAKLIASAKQGDDKAKNDLALEVKNYQSHAQNFINAVDA
jgi:hypothetical protein